MGREGQMRRRDVIAAAWPLAARAQQTPKLPGPTPGAPNMTGGHSSAQLSFSSSWLHSSSTAAPSFS